MASDTLSQSRGYRFAHREQDWRGWQVHDPAGILVGRVADVIIDTGESRVVALVLDTGSEVALEDVIVGDGSLVLWTSVAPVEAPALAPFQDGIMDITERVEVAALRKRPMVVEELLLTHDLVERELRIHTTLRRRDVDVERLE